MNVSDYANQVKSQLLRKSSVPADVIDDLHAAHLDVHIQQMHKIGYSIHDAVQSLILSSSLLDEDESIRKQQVIDQKYKSQARPLFDLKEP